jgi:hypothetical protein
VKLKYNMWPWPARHRSSKLIHSVREPSALILFATTTIDGTFWKHIITDLIVQRTMYPQVATVSSNDGREALVILVRIMAGSGKPNLKDI